MIKIQTNRAIELFEKAAASVNPALSGRKDLPIFSYWCKFFGENPDEKETSIKLIEPEVYNELESKSRLNSLVVKAGISNIFPATYTSVAHALNHKSKVNIWFAKPAHLSGGRGIQVVSTDELSGFHLPKYHILQEGLDEIALINGKKFTARVYVLVWNKNLYMFNDGFILIHGPQYVPGSTDYTVQVDHRGFEDEGEDGVKMERLSSANIHSHVLTKGFQAVQRLYPVFKNALTASSPLGYILLGIDLLVLNSGDIRFIEINAIPNFIHSPKINEEVNIPLFAHMMALIYGLKTSRYKIVPRV